jgi:deoxyribonuclease-4
MQLIGAHMPTGKGLGDAIRAGHAIGCTAVQVFTSSPQTWRAKAITDEMVTDFIAAQNDTGITAVVSHDSYLVNLCAPDPDKRAQSIRGLTDELNRSARYGIKFVVSHMGAHMGQGVEGGIRAAAESAKEVLADSDPSVMLLMETTAGQGSSLNHRFEELAQMQDQIGSDRIGVCLDTCHIFAAGYDIRAEDGYDQTFNEFDRLIGLDRLKVIHVNDSKKALGTRVDRHEHIGEGEIGETAFRLLVNDPRLLGKLMTVETPDAQTDHARNVAKLWSLISP